LLILFKYQLILLADCRILVTPDIIPAEVSAWIPVMHAGIGMQITNISHGFQIHEHQER